MKTMRSRSFRSHSFRSLLLALLALAAFTPAALALDPNDAAANAAGCFGCSTCMLFVFGGLIVHILIMVWVWKDATARRMDNAILWLLLCFFAPLIGIVVYLIVRTQAPPPPPSQPPYPPPPPPAPVI